MASSVKIVKSLKEETYLPYFIPFCISSVILGGDASLQDAWYTKESMSFAYNKLIKCFEQLNYDQIKTM